MKQVIYGKVYNTATAMQVIDLPCSVNRGDFGYHDTALYRTAKGAFFLAGTGGPSSRWARACGLNCSVGGSGILPLTEQEARWHLEDANAPQELFERCGLSVEEA